jgi:hypothetical protein
VPEVTKVVKHLLPDEHEKLNRKDTAKKLVDSATTCRRPRKWPRSRTPARRSAAGTRARKALIHVFGPDAPRFAALLAAMSPQTSVESNLRNALRTWNNWVAAGRPTNREKILTIMGTASRATSSPTACCRRGSTTACAR